MFWKQSGLLTTSLDVHHTAGATVFLTQNATRGGGGGSVAVCQCELVAMRKTRGGVKHKTGDRQETEIQQIHTAESKRERRKEKRGGGDKKLSKE